MTAIETERTDELSRIGHEYLDFAFLLDVNTDFFSLDPLTRRRERLRELFEAVGEVDGALSTAAFRASLRDWCRPRLVEPGRPLRSRPDHPGSAGRHGRYEVRRTRWCWRSWPAMR